jgi:mannose-1-phosphate guanylyltransferase/phosphomannomutase
VDMPGFRAAEGLWLGEGAEIDPTAKVEGPAIIGDYCRVEANVRLGQYTVLGSNVVVRQDADLERTVVHDNAYLDHAVRLRGTVVGRSCDLRAYARCEEGGVLGDDCFVGAHAVINPGVKIYPFKTVEQGAIINSSIVWESRGSRSLFGPLGISGLANVDITPELACRVAMAYGTTMKKGATVTTSRDSSRAARALKRAVHAGLNSVGVNVDDLEMAPVPVTRFQIRTERARGGITVRLAPNDPQSVVLRFFDAAGTDLDEAAQRKVEPYYSRQDFRRSVAAEIGDIGFAPRALEYYTAALVRSVDVQAIQSVGYQAVLDYGYGSTSVLMPSVLSKLGADVLAVNPYASTSGATAFDPVLHATRVAQLVRSANAHLGAVLDPDGEHMMLVDDEGHILTHDEALMVFVTLVGSMEGKARIALPVTVSRAAERIAAEHGAEIVWTKRSAAHLMDTAAEGGISFAASQDGGFIFPDFLPAYDATAALVKLLELLARAGTRLSALVAALPRTYISHETVVTPWEEKGAVMRLLVERMKDREMVLVDGVKVLHDNGWALVLPDPAEPLTHVWAEGASDAEARGLAQEYARRIRQMLR